MRDKPAILVDLKTLGRRIDVACAAYDALFRRLTSGTANISETHVKSSRGATDAMDALVAVGEERDALRARYAHAYTRTKELVSHIANDKYRDVLTCRYLVGMTAKKSAETLKYSPDYERELHRGAIAAFEEEQKKREGV